MSAIGVQIEALYAAAVTGAADSARLDLLQVVSRLEAAAAAAAGTEIAAEATHAADSVRRALAAVRGLFVLRGEQLTSAAERYELVDRRALRAASGQR